MDSPVRPKQLAVQRADRIAMEKSTGSTSTSKRVRTVLLTSYFDVVDVLCSGGTATAAFELRAACIQGPREACCSNCVWDTVGRCLNVTVSNWV